MTRILSELLGAREPGFRNGVRELEQASGLPSEDIRLTSQIGLETQAKLRDLNLDPHDTTGLELYHTLMERVARDSRRLEQLLGGAEEANLMPRLERLLANLLGSRQVFALKPAAARKLLRALPPKRVMKQLGYRSLDSLIKHEPVELLFAAARMAEPVSWHKSMLVRYKKLSPADFECRSMLVSAPTHERWLRLAAPYVQRERHNIVTCRELGCVVLLPLHGQAVRGAALATLLLTLQAMNDVASAGSYLKLQQVRPDFGAAVVRVTNGDPMAEASLAGVSLPWKLMHQFFAQQPQAANAAAFEPYLQAGDLHWRPVGNLLARVHPTFEFWHGAGHLGLAHEGQAVSLNPIDAVLNFCNQLPYEQRISAYLREHLWHELMLRYMRRETVAPLLTQQLNDTMLEPGITA